jgi:hypothetical protein
MPKIKYWAYLNKIASALKDLNKYSRGSKKYALARAHLLNLVKNEFTTKDTLLLSRCKRLKDVQILKCRRAVMDYLKECIYCYVNGQFAACITVAGALGERVTNDHVKLTLFYNRKPLRDQRVLNRFASSLFGQSNKLDVIQYYRILPTDIIRELRDIRKIRNDVVHPVNMISKDIQRTEAVKIMHKITTVVNALY